VVVVGDGYRRILSYINNETVDRASGLFPLMSMVMVSSHRYKLSNDVYGIAI
jgi:hypothetical protein